MLVGRNWSLLSYLFIRIIFQLRMTRAAQLSNPMNKHGCTSPLRWIPNSAPTGDHTVATSALFLLFWRCWKTRIVSSSFPGTWPTGWNTLQGNWTEGNVDGVGLWERTMKNSRRFSLRGPEACTYEDKTMGFVGAFLSDRSNRQDPGLPPHPAKQGTVWAKEVITPSCAFKPLMGGVAWGCWLSFSFY